MSPALWEARKEECRQNARQLLEETFVSTPGEIDLKALAFKAGRLTIEEGGLEGADGRIVADAKNSGKIRVKSGFAPERFRSTIAHEIGHCRLHAGGFIERTDSGKTFGIWNDASEEAAANTFAAELLFPKDFVVPRIRGKEPSIKLLETVAGDFNTSRLATAVQYIHYPDGRALLGCDNRPSQISKLDVHGSVPALPYELAKTDVGLLFAPVPAAQRRRRYAVCSGFEIARPVEIGNQPGLLRLPPQQFPSSQTRGLAVDRCEMGEPAKVVGCFVGGLGDDRHVQTTADHVSDVSERHALIRDPMIPGSCKILLKHEPVKMSSIEPVHRGPAVKPVTDICRNALFACDADE